MNKLMNKGICQLKNQNNKIRNLNKKILILLIKNLQNM